MSRKYLFYVTENYSFEILRPLQQVIRMQGDDCVWFAAAKLVNKNAFRDDEKNLLTIQEAVDYKPDAVFVPGNVVPDFISGLKVQVFHGLEYKKKGHFRIRGFFDLYCTHGPITTDRFNWLAAKHKYFRVVETGWPKLDALFSSDKVNLPNQGDRPCILYAPTFSPSLTSAIDLLPEITRQIEKSSEYWVFKFHPKMDEELMEPYRLLADKYANAYLSFDAGISSLLQTADVIVSDTSSVIGEFMLLNKPTVTYKNSQPGEELIDFKEPELLSEKLKLALQPDVELLGRMAKANLQLHPFVDGQSSGRVLVAVEEMLAGKFVGLKKKPLNLLRRFKLRKKMSYWKFE